MQTGIGTRQTASAKGLSCLPATFISRHLRCNQDAKGRCVESFRRIEAFRTITRSQIQCHRESDADRPNASTAVPLSTVCDILLLLKVRCILLKLLIFTDAASKLCCSSASYLVRKTSGYIFYPISLQQFPWTLRSKCPEKLSSLLQAADGIPPSEAEEMVGNLWSTQYMPPGVLCAFAGAETAGSAIFGTAFAAEFTHGVRFRFGDEKVCMTSLLSAGRKSMVQSLSMQTHSQARQAGCASNGQQNFKCSYTDCQNQQTKLTSGQQAANESVCWTPYTL